MQASETAPRPVRSEWIAGVQGPVEQAEPILLDRGCAHSGGDVAVTFGMLDASGGGHRNVLGLWRVRER